MIEFLKKKFSLLLIFIPTLLLIAIIGSFMPVHKNTPTTQELCYGSGSFEQIVNSCGSLIRKSDKVYQQLQTDIKNNSINAENAREVIRKKNREYLSSLSGLNINNISFQ